MQLVTFKKYKTKEEAFALINLLKSNNIEFQIEDISPAVDITFTGGTELEDKIAIKLWTADFDRVDKLLDKIANESIELVDNDHYLYDFSDNELFEILENYNEWSKMDYLLAKKILEERGKEISDEKIRELKNKKIAELSQAEKGHTGWMTFGFISAVLGGLLGIFIGYHHFKFKKLLPTGERVYAYNSKTRRSGLRMFYIGIVALLFWLIVWILDLI